MMLEGEKLPKIHHVTEKHLKAAFDESDVVFGQYVVLSTDQEGFIQSANVWELSDECEEFQERTQSEPYSLEYKDEATGELFAAEGWFTLEEVKDAFIEYLKGTGRWKKRKVWNKVEY
jgi:hypothetical protein